MSKHEKYEDISSSSTPGKVKDRMSYSKEKTKVFFMRNRKRNLKALLSVIICIVLVAAAIGGSYLHKMLGLINHDSGDIGNPDATFGDEEDVDENLSFATISDVGASSIQDYSKSWATNGGEKLYSKYVTNVLLIGADGDDGSLRSDTIMIASINSKTKKITLCSLMRDSYTYMSIDGEDRYDKINAAYAWGGAAKLMEVVSDDLKIKLDDYVSINFESFVKAVDQLGGINVPITEAEAKYMNRTTKIGGFTAGDSVKLNGKRALIYARIRKLDSDIERTRRQRNVISAVVKEVKASSLSDINSLVETFLPYITTNFKSSEIVSLGSKGLREGWQSYEIVGMVQPSEDARTAVNRFRTYSGNLFVWIVDYTIAAREVQLALYNNTNIEIGADHSSPVDMANGTDSTDSYNTSNYYSTTNYQYTYDTQSSVTESSTSGGFNWFTTNQQADQSSTRFVDRFSKPSESATEASVPDETLSQAQEPSSDVLSTDGTQTYQ